MSDLQGPPWAGEQEPGRVTKRKAFAARLRSRYGITVRDFNAKIRAQDGKCPICGKELKRRGRGGVCVDHNHKTKEFRGVLCGYFCNNKVVGMIERAGMHRTQNTMRYLWGIVA